MRLQPLDSIRNVTRFHQWLLMAGVIVVLTALAVLPAGAQELMHARISFDAGGGMVRGTSDADWSYATINTLILPGDTLWVDKEGTLELEMAGGSFLRMADGSKAEVVSLPPSAQFRGWTGSFYLHRISRSTGSFIFDTPVCHIDVSNNSHVRVDILGNGSTTVTVRWGHATIHAEGGIPVELTTGQRSYIDPGYLPSPPRAFDRSEEDAFDAWNRERVRLLVAGLEGIPARAEIASPTIGAADLARYGNWVHVDSSYYWQPTAVPNFRPYRHGHWSFVPAYGYVWVDDYPFSYVTSHYGRWSYRSSHGWLWSYNDVWGPAWVASIRYGSNFVWCPLDPWNRPVVTSAEYYSVGGLRFGMYASSYSPMDDLLFRGPMAGIYGLTPQIVRNVPRADINIWNLNINGNNRVRVPYRTDSLRVRDYSPRRVIRGLDTLGGRKEVARARVATLESSGNRTQFKVPVATGVRSVRTPTARSARSAELRTVKLDPEALAGNRSIRTRSGSSSSLRNVQPTRSARPASRAADSVAVPPKVDTQRGRSSGHTTRTVRSQTPTRVETPKTPSRSPQSTVRRQTTSRSPAPVVTTPSSSRTQTFSTPPSSRTRTYSTATARTPAVSTPSPSRAQTFSTSPSSRTRTYSTPTARAPEVSAPTRTPTLSRVGTPTQRFSTPAPSRTIRPTPTAAPKPAPSRISTPTPRRVSTPAPSRSIVSRSSPSRSSAPSISSPSRRSAPSIRSGGTARSAPSRSSAGSSRSRGR